jgi:5-formyltetrahydrofolate cyclo-ligase
MAYRVTVHPDVDPIRAAKTALRTPLIAARQARGEAVRRAARGANTGHLRTALRRCSCIAAYLPLPTEPLDPRFLDELATSVRVLVPVVTGSAPLDWCEYPVPVRRGAAGIDEPEGPRLGAAAIGDADAVLIPALAVDLDGHRLGRGGGHYDRTLALRARLRGPASPGLLIAVLYDDELLRSVPFDELDQPVSAIVGPETGVLPTPG